MSQTTASFAHGAGRSSRRGTRARSMTRIGTAAIRTATTPPRPSTARGCRLALTVLACVAGACGGSGSEREAADSAQRAAAADTTRAPGPAGTSADTSERRSSLGVATPATSPDEESGVVFRDLPGPRTDPGPHLRGGVLYAAAPSLTALLAPRVRVTIAEGRTVIDGRATDIPAHEHGGVPYVAVRPFARRFGAYTYLEGSDSSGSIFRREVLLHMRARGNTAAPAYRGAAAEGLVP